MRKNWIQAKEYYCGRLANAYHVNFMLRVVSRMAAFLNTLSDEERTLVPKVLMDVFNEFAQAVDAEDNAFKLSTKSDLTADIEAADQKRDKTYHALKGIIEAYVKLGNEKAKLLQEKLDLYDVDTKDDYEKEGSKLYQLCQELTSSARLLKALKECNADTIAEQLKEQNDECRALIDRRNADRASSASAETLLQLRKQSQEAYRTFIFVLNAYEVTLDAPDLDPLVRILNQDIDYYDKVVFARQNSSDKKDDPAPDPEPAPDPDDKPDPEDGDKPAEQ